MDVGGEICKWAWWPRVNGIFSGLEISIFPKILCVTRFSFYLAHIKSIYFSSIYNTFPEYEILILSASNVNGVHFSLRKQKFFLYNDYILANHNFPM